MNFFNKIRFQNPPSERKILSKYEVKETKEAPKSNDSPIYSLRSKSVKRTPNDQLRKKHKNKRQPKNYGYIKINF